jgi:hypothetical protein
MKPAAATRLFDFHIQSRRFEAPTVLVAAAQDEAQARQLAQTLLADSPQRLSVAVLQADRLICRVERQNPSPGAEAGRPPALLASSQARNPGLAAAPRRRGREGS